MAKCLSVGSRTSTLATANQSLTIQQALAFVGSVRPMDELRDALRQRLESEKARVNRQLEVLASSRQRIELAIAEAERQVDRLRQRVSSQ